MGSSIEKVRRNLFIILSSSLLAANSDKKWFKNLLVPSSIRYAAVDGSQLDEPYVWLVICATRAWQYWSSYQAIIQSKNVTSHSVLQNCIYPNKHSFLAERSNDLSSCEEGKKKEFQRTKIIQGSGSPIITSIDSTLAIAMAKRAPTRRARSDRFANKL